MRWPFRKAESRPAWDQAAANKFVGSTVLVGITYDEPEGERLSQFFGTVMSVNAREGITLRLEGSRADEVYTLPPDLRPFFPARAGSYRLRETGEVVNDPDYTATWAITPPTN